MHSCIKMNIWIFSTKCVDQGAHLGYLDTCLTDVISADVEEAF